MRSHKTLLIFALFFIVGAMTVQASLSYTNGFYISYMNGTGDAINVTGVSGDLPEVGTVNEVTGIPASTDKKAREGFSNSDYFLEADGSKWPFLSVSDTNWSMIIWYQDNGIDNTGVMFSARVDANHYWGLQRETNAIRWTANGGDIAETITWSSGSWYNTIMVYYGNNRSLCAWNNGTYTGCFTKDSTSGVVADIIIGNAAALNEAADKTIIDDVYVFDRALTSDEITEAQTKFAPFGDVITTTNINFTVTDDYNGSAINSFSINLSWNNGTQETLYTSTGNINMHNVSYEAHIINVTYWNITDYFDSSIYDQAITANTTNSVTATVFQAIACFNATEYISNNSVTPTNFTIGTVTRPRCFNLSAGTHDVQANFVDWYSENQTFTVAAFSNSTYVVENMTYTNLTVQAFDVTTGVFLSGYDITISSLNYTSWTQTITLATNHTFYLINGTYTVSVDASGYATTGAVDNITIITPIHYNFSLYPANSLNISFYDEITNSLMLSGINISFEIILDDADAVVNWTNTSTTFVEDLDSGDYEIRYRALSEGYTERSYYFTLENRTYNALSLFMLNDTATESITVTLYDEYGNTLDGYTIRLLRYYAAESGYLIVDEGLTNSEGQTVVNAIRNAPYYKFRILNSEGEVLKTTTSSQIYDTSITLYVVLASSVGETLEELNDISYELVWINSSDQFRFMWDASSGLIVSVTTYVYELDSLNGDVLQNSSTSSSASGTMYVGVPRKNETTFKAVSYVTFTGDSTPTLLGTLTITFDNVTLIFGRLGIFLTFLIVIVLALTGVANPAAPCILVPIGLIITKIARLNAMDWTWIIGITAVSMIILYVIRDKT